MWATKWEDDADTQLRNKSCCGRGTRFSFPTIMWTPFTSFAFTLSVLCKYKTLEWVKDGSNHRMGQTAS